MNAPSFRVLLLVVAFAGLIAAALWMSAQNAASVDSEQELELTLVCTTCNHIFHTSYGGLLNLIEEARAKGLKDAGQASQPFVGFCPKCGKPSVCRATEDETGTLILPESAAQALTAGRELPAARTGEPR